MTTHTASTTVKVRIDLRDRINRLKERQQTTINELLSAALDRWEEDDFWRRQAQAHAALQANPDLLAQVQAEADLWDNTLLDGFRADPAAQED